MTGFRDRATVAQVEELIARRISVLGAERLPFSLARGRVLAEQIRAPSDVPPHPKSAMDGYAVRASDLPGKLEVIGEIMAAQEFDRSVGAGQAVRIMPGARIPAGADAVAMVEATKLDGSEVAIDRPLAAGANILPTGADLTAGAVVLESGRRLRPQDLAMLASVGALEVAVVRRPRVRIVPTGNELHPIGSRPERGVVESNSFLLAGLAERDGADPILHPIVPDDTALLLRAMTAPGADIVVLTGGSSVGKEDLAAPVLSKAGELAIHGVHVKPASPTGIGFVGSTAIVLAPGYPVASFVAWDLFVRPIVQRMAGLPVALPYRTTRATLFEPLKKPSDRVEIARVVLESTGSALPRARVLPGGAAILSTITRADGFLLLPSGVASFAAGAELDVHLYDL
jgi:molybdopterin molybdotransferase